MQLASKIAGELGVREGQVRAAVSLLDEGATVPFIARYRKEATGGLDDTQLRRLEERVRYLRELDERRAAILRSIDSQGKLTSELRAAIEAAETKTRLEDLYLPYRPKRRTRGQVAREAGLEPLADLLLTDPERVPEEEAAAFVNPEKGVPGVAEALDGARYILMERFAEDADLLETVRERLWCTGLFTSRVVPGQEQRGAKFTDYFDYSELLRKVPSHRALAVFRGRKEKILQVGVGLPADSEGEPGSPWNVFEREIALRRGIEERGRPADAWLSETVRGAWRLRVFPHAEAELLSRLREAAEDEAIRVFSRNLRHLLLAAPAGPRPVLGLDPGLRTGVKYAVVDGTGKLVEHGMVFPHAPKGEWDQAIATLRDVAAKHAVKLVSIGNGTGSRETDRLAADLARRHPELGLQRLVVSEAGASVYSASKLAAEEFPDLNVSFRGAVSIARRLQDPLAELVKIEPRSIGVGQYQHDVHQGRLARALDAVVEDCVNAVGVDLNTASVPLLSRVSGLNRGLARSIVEHRDARGPFGERGELRSVARLGEKAFQLAAGFLRIRGGTNPLDASAVHPEAYPVVERILARTGRDIGAVVGDTELLRSVDPEEFTDVTFGLPTVVDILAELEKPGRDPRPEFRAPRFQEGVEEPEHLKPGMVLEGVVTNVTNFGAFVDLGVHLDGLVHVSQLAGRYVKDPAEVVRAGDVVKVKVMEVDLERRRIGLTMCLEEAPGARPRKRSRRRHGGVGRDGGGRAQPRQGGEARHAGKEKDRPREKGKTEGARVGERGQGESGAEVDDEAARARALARLLSKYGERRR